MNRIDRLSAILIQLQSKKVVKAHEIAERFEISLRTVYRDVRALEEAGVPIGAEAGKGYFIMEGYHLPPVMFTKSEAGALLTGAKLMKLADKSLQKEFDSALLKVKSVLRTSDKDFLASLDASIEVFPGPGLPKEEFPNNFITDIQQAIVHKHVLDMSYYSYYNQTDTHRKVEPIGLFYYRFGWHMIAFCRLRNDYRDFRIDRIRNLSNSYEVFNSDSKDSLQTYIHKLSQIPGLVTIIVRVEKDSVKYLYEHKFYYGFVSEIELNNQVEMTFVTGYPHLFSRWLLIYGTSVEIMDPPEVKIMMQQLIKEIKSHYV